MSKRNFKVLIPEVTAPYCFLLVDSETDEVIYACPDDYEGTEDQDAIMHLAVTDWQARKDRG